MSYAIIRNAKYKRNNLKGIFRHNERRNKNYSNKNIKPELSYLNYSLKDCTYIYEKEFDLMREKYNLKGQVKSVSNIICEYIITSDQKYFESIGEEETRRYFQTAYKYVTKHGFKLERGLPKEETNRKHYSVKEFKQITNFEKTKELLENMTLELPKVPELKDMKKVMIGRDDKILNEIIKPKDKLIKELYRDNLVLHKELSKQANIIEEVEKYQNERDKIIADNEQLNNTVKHLEHEYKKKSNTLDLRYINRKRELEKEFEEKNYNIEYEYKSKVRKLEKENNKLRKIIDKFYETIDKFIHWICVKFDIAEEDNLIRDFQKETNTFLDPEKQIKKEEREMEWDLER